MNKTSSLYTNSIYWQGVIGEYWLYSTCKYVLNDNLNQESITVKEIHYKFKSYIQLYIYTREQISSKLPREWISKEWYGKEIKTLTTLYTREVIQRVIQYI